MLSYANVKRQTFPESEVGNLLYANFFIKSAERHQQMARQIKANIILM